MKIVPPGKMIPPVSVDPLICAFRKVAADHEAGLSPDVTVSTISALHGKCESEEMLAIQWRLIALANLVDEGEGDWWTIDVDGKDHKFVAEPLVRAAATAPLKATKMVRDLRFEPDILDIALQDVEPDGSS